jgi:hypothetical protein
MNCSQFLFILIIFVNVQIPTEGGRLFRLEGGRRSDLKPAAIPI